MSDKRYKVEREGQVWSLGYPSLKAAQRAARRLNQYSPHAGRHKAAEMAPEDYETLRNLEEQDQ